MTRRRLPSVAALLLVALVAVGCATGSESSDDAGGAAPQPAGAPAEDGVQVEAADGAAFSTASRVNAAAPDEEQALISHGNVQLRSDDVGAALFEVQKVVDQLAGEISQNETATDDDGEVKRARIVARIPSARFTEAMQSLEGAATLVASSSDIDDVTTKVIDNRLRLEVQKRSIRRIALLLERAQSIRDIVNIEGQLSRRQADLQSLQRQQAYLADQTRMATITVSLERTEEEKAETKEKEEEAKGFVAGLDQGWDGFTTVAVGLATAAGAALPFLVVLALVGFPAWAVLRRRRTAPAAPTEA